MIRTGVCRYTLRILQGWDHVRQSLGVLVSTAIGERVQRRDFGLNIEDMLDKPQNDLHLIKVYSEIANAITPRTVNGLQYGEPGYRLNLLEVTPSVSGKVTIQCSGEFFPFGHLGDFTQSEAKTFTVVV
jgi:uncharacterized protein